MPPLMQRLHALRRHIWLGQGLRYAVNALLVAGIAACVWLLAARLFALPGDAAIVASLLFAAGFVAAIGWAIYKRPDIKQAALAADLRLGLRERLTSSLELQGAEGPMVEAVHRDALHHAMNLDAREQFPLVPPRTLRWVAVPVILFGLGYMFLPEFDLFGHQEREAQAKVQLAARELKAKKLSNTAKALKPADPAATEPLARTAQEIESIAEQLRHGEMTEKQAIAKLSNLQDTLATRREALQSSMALPKFPGDASKFGPTKGMADDLANGRAAAAAQKAKELKKKLAEGTLGEDEKKKIAEELKKMSEMLGKNSKIGEALAQALAEAGQNLDANSLDGALSAMEDMQLSLEDLASALEQMAKMDAAMAELGEWKQDLMGPSQYCRDCGKKLKPCKNPGNCKSECGGDHECAGACSAGQCSGSGRGAYRAGIAVSFGNGMGGPGQGRGSQVGELPDAGGDFKPTVAPGSMTKGKMLANILQKGAPETGGEATAEFVPGAFVEVQQQAENALTKEEIPDGAKEFVRQYFGAIDPAAESADESVHDHEHE